MPASLRVRFALVGSLLAATSTSFAAVTTLRIANYNMANHPNSPTDDASLKTIFGYAGTGHAIDVMAMVEADQSYGTSVGTLKDLGSNYAQVLTAPDGGGDCTGFVYNTSTVQLISTATVGSGTITHPSLRAQFRPVGTTGAQDFYMYAVHLQSGSTSAIRAQRATQAQYLRTNADALGSANVIFGGDFNWQGADEITGGGSAFRAFNADGPGQVFDPINQIGAWNANAAYKQWHTNDPGGSMDDRFDLQLVSGELMDGVGLDYVTGSYNVVGNNGTHTLKAAITTGTGAPADVLAALADFSDHLPVVADYAFAVPEPSGLCILFVAGVRLLRRRPKQVCI